MGRALLVAAIARLGIVTLGLPAAEAFRNVPPGTRVPALTLGARAGSAAIQVPTPGRATVVFFWRPGSRLCDAALADLVALAPTLRRHQVDVVAVAENGSARLPEGVSFDVALDHARGAAATAERRFADAAEAFEQALALRPAGDDARLRLTWVRLETGDARAALAAFDAVLAHTPSTRGARGGAGLARLALGQEAAGVRLLEQALVLNPEPVRAHYALGRAYERQGDAARAVEHFRSALLKLLQGGR